MRPVLVAGVMLATVLCSSLEVGAAEAEKIAVMPLQAKRVAASTASILDDLLMAEIEQRSGMRGVSAQDINAILGFEKMKDVAGCSDVSCAAEIGGALGVRFLLTGSVSALGGEVIITLSLINTAEAVVTGRAQTKAPDDERSYGHAVATAVARLFGQPDPPPPASQQSAAPSPSPSALAPLASPRGTVAIRTQRADAFQVTLTAEADGLTRTCAADVAARSPCLFEGLPAGDATLAIGDEEIDIELPKPGMRAEVEIGKFGPRAMMGAASGIVAGGIFAYFGARMSVSAEPGDRNAGLVLLGCAAVSSLAGWATALASVAFWSDPTLLVADAAHPASTRIAAAHDGWRFVGLGLAPAGEGMSAAALFAY